MQYEEMDSNKIAETLRMLREQYGETIEKTAEAVGTSGSAIAMYESGKRIPRDEIKIRIAEHYKVPVEYIFFPIKQHVSCDDEKGA